MAFSAAPSPSAPAPVTAPEVPDGRSARLVAAARQLANETGDADFTVAQVSLQAGLSLKSFYRCFRGKDELLLALIEDDSRIGAEIIAERIADHPNPRHAFARELLALANQRDAAGYAGFHIREHRRLAEHYSEELHAALAPLTTLLAQHLDTADPGRDARTMLEVLIIGIHDVVLGRVDDVDELADYLYGFCARGLEG
jgi:AcrR family transcriptional regulator